MVTFRRKKGAKRSHPVIPRKGTAFGPPENASLARDVHAQSREDARDSADQLQKDFDGARTREKKAEVYHATLNEANRLEIEAHNMNNGPEARESLAGRERVFRGSADRMHAELYG
jgi:hypothetical protein